MPLGSRACFKDQDYLLLRNHSAAHRVVTMGQMHFFLESSRWAQVGAPLKRHVERYK